MNRHGTGTVDPVISAPTHEDGTPTDLMEILPSESCVMSHFEIELSFERLNNGMVIHLKPGVCLGRNDCIGPKMDLPDRVILRVPKKVSCSIFNDILPIRDRWIFHLNNCHWLIRTQTWAICAKD